MENFNTSIKNLSKNKLYSIVIGLAAIILATVLIYAYVEFLSDKISIIPTEEGKPYCGAIGSRSEGWYINSDSNRPELIRWDNCKGCSAVCKAIGTFSEGWYSFCDGKLIKYDNCGEGQEEGNLPPVIDELTAPTQLQVNEKGVWTIKAHDPENGALSYSVNWGDEYEKIPSIHTAPAELDTRSQTTTFAHSYNKIGTYTIKFIVTDDHHQTAKASTTVKVVSEISEATCTDSDGGINKYVKGTTCRKLHYGSSTGTDMISCKTDMCDGICYSQSTSTNLEEKKDNITPSTPPSNSEAPLVKEYYCENNKIMSKHIHCENGCKNGACVKVAEEDCTPKGERAILPFNCCPGLKLVSDCLPGEPCPISIKYCVDCGNGICEEHENWYNCPEDCEGVCHKKLNKEDCESFGGEYKSACIISGGCHYWCQCPCKTDSDCGVDRCDQGRDVCHELKYKCENGKCDYTDKEYKGYSCARYYDPASATPEKCLDTCGDGVCKSPETQWWCPEDCKGCVGDGEVKSVLGECCAGLHVIASGYRNNISYCTSEICGNGECKELENKWNCPEDCEGVCHNELNKEDCELTGGEYICAVGGTETICHCQCPCKTNDDCVRNRCGLGRSAKSDYPYWCIEHRDNCVNGKCVYTQKEYKNRTCGGIKGIECVDACGDGVCKGSEAAWCPEDCKEETGSITITSPNGDEELEAGRFYNFSWKSEQGIDIHDKLNIYLVDESKESICTENGKCCYTCSNWKKIIHLVNFGMYRWEIPIDQETGNKYKIYIRTLSDGNDCFKGCVEDKSDNYFSIVEKKAHPCTDTDGGKDYYKKGTVTLRDISSNEILREETDYCEGFGNTCETTDCPGMSDIIVTEYYCENNEIKLEAHNCPNKCKDGACIKGETLSADLNCDGKVNLADAAILLSWWSKDSSDQNSNVNQDGLVEEEICSPCKNPDINQDGKVNLADFSIMMSQWTFSTTF